MNDYHEAADYQNEGQRPESSTYPVIFDLTTPHLERIPILAYSKCQTFFLLQLSKPDNVFGVKTTMRVSDFTANNLMLVIEHYDGDTEQWHYTTSAQPESAAFCHDLNKQGQDS